MTKNQLHKLFQDRNTNINNQLALIFSTVSHVSGVRGENINFRFENATEFKSALELFKDYLDLDQLVKTKNTAFSFNIKISPEVVSFLKKDDTSRKFQEILFANQKNDILKKIKIYSASYPDLAKINKENLEAIKENVKKAGTLKELKSMNKQLTSLAEKIKKTYLSDPESPTRSMNEEKSQSFASRSGSFSNTSDSDSGQDSSNKLRR